MMDVPDALLEITKASAARSTHLNNPETPEQLTAKTRPLSEKWEPVAKRLFEEMPAEERKRFAFLSKMSAKMKK